MKNMDKGILTNSDMKKPKYKILYAIMVFLMIGILLDFGAAGGMDYAFRF